jgi:signal peptidase I
LQTLDSKFLKIAHDKDEEIIKDMLFELFEKEKKGWFRVISDSMSPLIEVNERVLVRKEGLKQIRLRDIILFGDMDVLVTHRVVGRIYENGRLYLLQKGDRGGSASKIPSESVLGRIVAVEKNGRLLRLDCGWGRMVNTLLGINNYALYQIGTRADVIKKGLRDKPGFRFLKFFYRILKKPFILLNRGMVKLITSGIWMITKVKGKR